MAIHVIDIAVVVSFFTCMTLLSHIIDMIAVRRASGVDCCIARKMENVVMSLFYLHLQVCIYLNWSFKFS